MKTLLTSILIFASLFIFGQGNWGNYSNDFISDSKLKSSCLSYQRLDSMVYEVWDRPTQSWIFSGRYIHEYDLNGNLGIRYSESGGNYISFSKEEFYYDVYGNNIQTIDYNLDVSTETWKARLKRNIEYDQNGNLIIMIISEWDIAKGEWVPIAKLEYSYNANGLETEYMSYEWEKYNKEWKVTNKYESDYNSNGYLIETRSYVLNSQTGEWLCTYKSEMTYDSGGRNKESINYMLNENSNELKLYNKDEKIYDSNGNNIQTIQYYFGGDEEWFLSSKRECYFDDKGNILNEINYIWGDSEWVFLYRYFYYYSEQNVLNINDLKEVDLKIYPNPVSDYLNIDVYAERGVAFLELYDINGCKLMARQLKGNEILDLRNIEGGIYFYVLTSGKSVKKGKLLKRR